MRVNVSLAPVRVLSQRRTGAPGSPEKPGRLPATPALPAGVDATALIHRPCYEEHEPQAEDPVSPIHFSSPFLCSVALGEESR
jgi:hypothetical protein